MVNKVFLMGRITRDLELKHSSSGVPLCNFSIAVQRSFLSNNGQREVDFINIVAWRKQAEFISKYFSKGRLILVIGPLRTRQWDGNDGIKRTSFEVNADEVHFCDSKNQSDNMSSSFGSSGSFGFSGNEIDESFFDNVTDDIVKETNQKTSEEELLNILEEDDIPF